MAVTIGAYTFPTYGDAAGLSEYAAGSLAYAATHAAAEVDDAARALVEATRVITRLPFLDATHADPTTSGLPAAIVTAAYELALAGLADPAIFTSVSTAKNIKRVNAKGAEVEFFAPTAGGRVPGRVAELLAEYLEGAAGTVGGSFAYGTDDESDFDDCDRYGVTGP